MSGGVKYATFCPGFDRSTPTLTSNGSSRADRLTPPEMETTNCCRGFLLSKLRAIETLNGQMAEDARSTNRLRSVHPPGQFNLHLAIEQVHAQLLDLIETDVRIIRQLLNVGEQLEELRWQKNYGAGGGGGDDGSPYNDINDMSLADIESVDFDPYIDYLTSPTKHPLPLTDYVTNGDDADDVFQNDVTGRSSAKPIQSNELHLTLTRSKNGVKVKRSDDNASHSRAENKLTKVKFQVRRTAEQENNPLLTEVTAKGHIEVKENNKETAKIQLKLRGKDPEQQPLTVSPPSLQFRLVLQPTTNGLQEHPQ